jgi:sterol desaturase/sphingolipid hydroxylase (fatty acid hydroxylase superfamily)
MLFIVVLVGSIIIASFFGHAVHWALHQPSTRFAHRAHMQHHMVHYPMGRLVSDEYIKSKWRESGPLLFTPPLLIILCGFGGLLWVLRAPHWTVWVLGIVLVGFGLLNDYIHDVLHIRRHPLLRFRWYREMRKLHFLHHFDMRCNFGIFNFTWDSVFGTKLTKR